MKQSAKLALIVLPAAAFAALGAAASWMFGSEGRDSPSRVRPSTVECAPVATSQPAKVEPTPEMAFDLSFAAALDDAARLKLLESLLERPWAKATTSVLIDTMQRSDSPPLRAKAFDVALDLAKRPDKGAKSAVLKSALDSRHADVRTRSLRECRLDPQPELLDDLLQAARMGVADRFLAVHALAALDDPRAEQCVLDAAKDENLPKAERARAIALLARSKLPEAVDYLKELATKPDSEYAGVATETLAAIQQARAFSK